MLGCSLSDAVIVWLCEDVRPAILEEVERRLSIEGKHAEPVGRLHAVTKELNSVTWNSMWYLRGRLRELRNSHNGVLRTAENASVRGVRRSDELHERDCASRVNFLDSSYGHGVRSGVK